MMTATIDASVLRDKLASLYDASVGKDAAEIVSSECKQLSRTIVNFVPPLTSSARRIGEHAVEVGISAVFSEASPLLIDEIVSKYGLQNVSTAYVTEQSGTKLQLDWQRIDPLGERIAELHQQHRDQRGHTPRALRTSSEKWSARVVVTMGTKQPYVDKVKARVGMWKATWGYAAGKLGFSFPRWLARHFPSLTMLAVYRPDLQGQSPSITFGSRFPGNFRIRPSIQQAVNVRVRAIQKRIKLILHGYKTDFENSARVSPKANQIRAEEAPAIT